MHRDIAVYIWDFLRSRERARAGTLSLPRGLTTSNIPSGPSIGVPTVDIESELKP